MKGSWEKTNVIFEFLVQENIEKKFLPQISCHDFEESKFLFSNKFKNQNYTSIEFKSRFQSAKLWFSVNLYTGAMTSLWNKKMLGYSPPIIACISRCQTNNQRRAFASWTFDQIPRKLISVSNIWNKNPLHLRLGAIHRRHPGMGRGDTPLP